jgi:hypothetical protein
LAFRIGPAHGFTLVFTYAIEVKQGRNQCDHEENSCAMLGGLASFEPAN